jgi:hypothetical protein
MNWHRGIQEMNELAETVACLRSTCLSEAGKPCQVANGGKADYAHAVRVQDALKARRKK